MCKTVEKYHQEVNKFRSSMRKGYILFIDDNDDLATVLCLTLERRGQETRKCSTKEDAMTMIINDHENIKCVVVDLHLSGMEIIDGEQMVEFIENHESKLPYVVYTGDPNAGAYVKKKHRRSTVILKGDGLSELFEAVGIDERRDTA